MFELMVFMFLFFIGFMAMFYYLLSRQSNFYRQLSDEHAQLRVLIRALEFQLDQFRRQENPDKPEQPEQSEASPGQDPLLHLSFEQTSPPDQSLDNAELEMNLDLTRKA